MGEPPARIIPNDNLHRLADLIKHHREELLATWRQEIRRLPAARNYSVGGRRPGRICFAEG